MTLTEFLLARIADDESFAKLSLTYGPQMGYGNDAEVSAGILNALRPRARELS